MRRAAGFAAMVLAVFALLLCIAGAVVVRMGNSRIDAVLAAVFGTADDAFEFMDTRLERVNQTLSTSRQRLSELSQMGEKWRDTNVDAREAVEPLSQTLDEVFAELQAAEHWLDSLQAVAAGVNRVSAAVSEQAAMRHKADESAGMAAGRVAEFSADVADIVARLQILRRELIDLRENGTVAREFAAALISRFVELDESLARVSAKIDAFNAKLSEARASSDELGRRVRWWAEFGAVMLMLVLLWFAVSQVFMIRYGWRGMVRTAGASVPAARRDQSREGRPTQTESRLHRQI